MEATCTLWILSIVVLVIHGIATSAEIIPQKRVRFDAGVTPYEGRVEVFFDDKGWTPVCSRDWDLYEADILCNELVFNDVGAMLKGIEKDALGGDSRGRVIDTNCTVDEASLADCRYNENKGCSISATAKCNYFGYLGCYNHDKNNPSLPDGSMVSDNMTIQLCLDYCRQLNTSYAGLYGRLKDDKMTCFCGLQNSAYWSNGEAVYGNCKKLCLGDTSNLCGGQKELAVYSSKYVGDT
ncbi:lysyl oxidase homolog 2-like [Glandiceps talaboti]